MKLLITSINFWPAHSGIALYSTDLPVYMAEKGYDVTMVTGFSYYPKWRKLPEDNHKLFASETYERVRVLRGYLYVPKNVSVQDRFEFHDKFTLGQFDQNLITGIDYKYMAMTAYQDYQTEPVNFYDLTQPA